MGGVWAICEYSRETVRMGGVLGNTRVSMFGTDVGLFPGEWLGWLSRRYSSGEAMLQPFLMQD